MKFFKDDTIRLWSKILGIIPLFCLSILFMSDKLILFTNVGGLNNYGILALVFLVFLVSLSFIFFKYSKLLFNVYVSFILVFISIFFVFFDLKNYILQSVVVFFSLYLILYVNTYKESNKSYEVKVFNALLLHNIILLVSLVLSVKFDLFNILWNKVFILFYAGILFIIFGIFFINNIFIKNFKILFITLLILLFLSYISNITFFIFTLFFLNFLVFYFLLTRLEFNKFLIDSLFNSPYKLLIFSFLFIILIGSIILSFPFASVNDKGISFIDSLFTSTSATCVTGLIVLDTPVDFSFVGQIFILLLIQVGGLGIVAITTFVSSLLGQNIGVNNEFVVSEIIGSKRPRYVYDLIKVIVVSAFIIELVGAIILTYGFSMYEKSFSTALWKGVFHSVSAFCNAGFSLQSDSLMGYSDNIIITSTVSLLIILGGIGFPAFAFFKEYVNKRNKIRNIPIIFRFTVYGTIFLLVLGYFILFVFEQNNSLNNLPSFYKHINAFFYSVTARTAGFNTTDLSLLSSFSAFFIIILMFIGGNSCSTSGGIKISTIGTLFAFLFSYIKGNNKIVIYSKEISERTLKNSIIIFFTSILVLILFILLLFITQNLEFKETIFEAVSAFGTVGLSLGATMKLDDIGKFLIILLMFIGRVGVLSIFSIFIINIKHKGTYVKENIVVG